MENNPQELWDWVALVSEYSPLAWERLPELELYMDQVITMMNRQLEPFAIEGDRLLTPSMINNYVKDEVLPRPAKKKYSRNHLAMLMMICMLKSVLSLPEIDAMLRGLTADQEISSLYPEFVKNQSEALRQVASRVEGMEPKDEAAQYRMALELALEANARRIAAARILHTLSPREEKDGKKDKSK